LAGTDLEIVNEPVATPNSPNNQIPEQDVFYNLESHYSGELPEYQQQMTSDITFDEVVMTENPPQQHPNQIRDHIETSDSLSQSQRTKPDPKTSVDLEPNTSDQTESDQSTSDQNPSSSNLSIELVEPTFSDIPKPPSVFLHLPFLATVCLDIFKKAKQLIETRHDMAHGGNYQKQWKRVVERVQLVFSEIQRSSLDDQAQAQNKLKDWLKGVMSEVHKVKVLRTWARAPLCLEARSVIPSYIHPRDLNLDWIKRINMKEASTELALAQRNSLLEKENHALRKELLEQKMMLLDYKNSTEAQLAEAKNREERLIRDNEDLKKEMKQQAEAQKAQMEETQRMKQKMMEMMMQKQANP